MLIIQWLKYEKESILHRELPADINLLAGEYILYVPIGY